MLALVAEEIKVFVLDEEADVAEALGVFKKALLLLVLLLELLVLLLLLLLVLFKRSGDT